MSVHRFGLNDPRRKILLPQCPEDRHERDRNKNIEQNLERLLVENRARIRPQASRRNMDEFLPPDPKENRREDHEDTWQTECDDQAVKFWTLEKTHDARRQASDESARRRFVRFE